MAKPKSLTSGELDSLDPKMLWQMALGLEDPRDIALRWGYTPEKYDDMAASPYFQRQLDALRAENERTGQNFRSKAGVMSQKLMDMIFSEAVGGDTELKNRLEVLKTLAKYADWEPKSSNVEASSVPAFSIQISLPPVQLPVEKPVEAEDVKEVKPEMAKIELDFSAAAADKAEKKDD